MSATTVPHSGADLLQQLDDSGITPTHWKIMFISGTGFFTDAYDLFVIGVVMSLLKGQWLVSPTAGGLVTSTALLASAIGAVLFGRIAAMLGRKRIYGYEVLVLAAGAVASALSPNIWWLIVFRFILGIGIGGDYPVSSTIMGEYAGKKTRRLLITLVFSMQAAGLVVGPALAAALLASGLSHNLTWRLLLAFGAVPAMAVFWMRRRMAETPRFLLHSGQHDDLHAASRSVLGFMDRLGRKAIQNLGFLMMAIAFGIMSIVPDIEKIVVLFLIVYGVSYFFTEFGPNSTTFVYPAELFPVETRTTGHGVASAAGKIGGFAGVFLFPIFMSRGGLRLAEGVAALVSLLGLVVTIFRLPETKGLSLEELSGAAIAEAT